MQQATVLETASSAATIRLVAIAATPAPYRAFEFDWLARALGDRISFHVMFLERSWAHMAWKDDLPKLATWELLPRVEWKALRRIPGLHRVNTGVVRCLERARPDVLLLHGYDAPALWTAVRWARRHGIPLLYRGDSNGPDERRRKGLWFAVKAPVLRWYFSRFDAYMPIGSASADYLRLYGAADDRFFCTGFQVDNQLFRNAAEQERSRGKPLRATLGISESQRLILFVGRFVPQKGILDLVDAYQRILPEFPDLGLLLAGDGPLRGEIERRCAKIRDHVFLPGFLQPADLGRVYGIADVFVLPSTHEPWGLVVNEALAAGLPVITSDRVGAALDLVRSGVSGEQFPAGDVAALADCLRQVLNRDRIGGYRAGALRQIDEWTTNYDPVRAYDQAVQFALDCKRRATHKPV